MMLSNEPIKILPIDIQRNWGAALEQAIPTEAGAFRLVGIRAATAANEQQRITVLVVDENGYALPGIKVAFSFSTAEPYFLTDDFQWTPPYPQNAFVVATQGSGQIDMVLGPEGVVKQGQRGGVTVYLLEPEYSSDVVSGCGMMADHTGLHLTFQLFRTGVVPLEQRLAAIEARLAALEDRVG